MAWCVPPPSAVVTLCPQHESSAVTCHAVGDIVLQALCWDEFLFCCCCHVDILSTKVVNHTLFRNLEAPMCAPLPRGLPLLLPPSLRSVAVLLLRARLFRRVRTSPQESDLGGASWSRGALVLLALLPSDLGRNRTSNDRSRGRDRVAQSR